MISSEINKTETPVSPKEKPSAVSTSEQDLKPSLADESRPDTPLNPARVSDLFFQDEKGQKAVLVILSLICMVGLTWLLKTNGPMNAGIRTNVVNILWFSSVYFFFQCFDRLFSLFRSVFQGGTSPKSNFSVEFMKFYLALNSSFIYNQNFLGSGVFKALKVYGVLNYLTTYAIMSLLAATVFYRYGLLKDLALKSRVAQAEAQYSLLESQMQPHFLFNSLNVLSELIYVDPDLANSMSQKLADLYREILQNSKNKFCSLESELSILTKYVEIQKIRFGDRVRFHMKVDPKYKNLLVPSLMLQTLVENAIKHGVSPKKDGGDIYFDIQPVGNRYEISISNTGELYKGHHKNKRSTGLQNTQNRLALIYGNKHDFKIYSDEKKTYVKFNITGRTS